MQKPLFSYATKVGMVLTRCRLPGQPHNVLLSFQARERPNTFYPIRVQVPQDMFEKLLDPTNDYYIVVVEFNQEHPARWARFRACDFQPSRWVRDGNRACVDVSTKQVNDSLIPLDGGGGLLPEPSFVDWMRKQYKEQNEG